jgi:hypothetical protein
MATRRKLGNFADIYLRFHLQKQLAEQNAEAVASRQMAANTLDHEQAIDRAAIGDPSGRIASITNRNQYRQNPKGLLAELAGKIGSAQNLNELPDSGSVRNMAGSTLERAGYRSDGAVEGVNGLTLPMKSKELASVPGEGGVPTLAARAPMSPAERPEIEALMAQREGRQESILNAEAFKSDQELALAKGKAHQAGLGANMAENETLGDKMGRNTKLGANALEIELNKRRAIDPLDIKKAGASAGASAYASEAARLTPKFVDARVDEELRKAKSRAEIAAQFGRLPDSAMRARGILPIVIESNEKAKLMEKGGQGQKLGWMQMAASQSPLFSGFLNNADEQQYAQAANEFTNYVTLTLTGVTARQDEKAAYIATYFPNKGEDVRTVQAKQHARDRFIGFVESMARQGKQFSSLTEAQAAFESGGADQGGQSGVINYQDFLSGDPQ